MTALAPRVRAGLALREAVLALFANGNMPAPQVAALRTASAATWQLLLRAESSAVPIAQQLRLRSLDRTLAEDVKAVIRDAQAAEMQRVLVASAVLRDVDDIARTAGVQLTVLKGGALVAEERENALDLGDVDLLVAPRDAASVWRALTAQGWSPVDKGITAVEGRALTSNHYSQLKSARHGFTIELHEALRYGSDDDLAERIGHERITGLAALRRATGAAYVIALLRHVVILHPWRRGHLRDLLLIAREMQRLAEQERDAVRNELAGDRYAPELLAMHDQCVAIQEGRPVVTSAESRAHVALKYLAALSFGGPLTRIPGWIPMSHYAFERAPVRRAILARELREVVGPIPAGTAFEHLQRRIGIPVVGTLVAWPLRVAYRALVIGAIASSAWLLRRHVSQALRATSA